MSDRRAPLLAPEQVDNLGFAVIALARELWVMKDRQLVTEALLREKGLLGDLETYQPDQALKDSLTAERERFVGDIIAALVPPVSPL